MDWLSTLPLRDPVSSLTHLGTAVFALYATLLFIRLTAGDAVKRRSMLVYGLSMVVLYTASGVYHAVPGEFLDPTVCFYRRIDISAIFLLIAGSFTPVISVLLAGRRRRVMLTLMWSLAAAGIALKWLAPGIPHPVTVCTFAIAGLPGFLPFAYYWRALDGRGWGWTLAGCLCFAAGGICDVCDWPTPIPGLINSHEVTHLLDMGGSAFHVIFMVRYVVPYRRPAEADEPIRRTADPDAVAVLESVLA
jgi:hemolysin III